jgi:hypothetical protein
MRNDARASNPGLVRIQLLRTLTAFRGEWHFAFWLAVFITMGIILLTALMPKGPLVSLTVLAALVIGPFISLAHFALLVFMVREHIWHGCICPAVIFTTEPAVVAVSTDLSKGGVKYPAIKLIRQPLKYMEAHRASGRNLRPWRFIAPVPVGIGPIFSQSW